MSQSIVRFLALFRTQSHFVFGGTIDLTIATPRNCNTPTLDQRGESKTSNTPTPTNKVAATPRSNASVFYESVRKCSYRLLTLGGLTMKLTTWNRDKGYVVVVLFENGTSAAVFDKVMKTEQGAINYGNRIKEVCGDNYEHRNLTSLQYSTDAKTGNKVRNFHYENLTNIK